MTTTCPGCVGRGTGRRCCMCDQPIPVQLRRQPDSPAEIDLNCTDCRRGAIHTHN